MLAPSPFNKVRKSLPLYCYFEDMSQELIAIDLNKLTNGAYQLEIVIADTKDKAIMASAQKEFILID